MSSESESEPRQTRPGSVIQRLITSRNRDLSLFLPFLIGIHGTDPPPAGPESDQNSPDPDPNPANEADPESQRERIVLINPFTQAMVIVEGEALRALLRADPDKIGPPPASRAAIEALPAAEIGEGEAGECVVCLEGWRFGDDGVKEMPCKHRFHGGCIDRWLGIHGSCPVCRFEMPCDLGKRGWGGERGVWVGFNFGGSGSDPDRSSSDDGGGSDGSSLEQMSANGN